VVEQTRQPVLRDARAQRAIAPQPRGHGGDEIRRCDRLGEELVAAERDRRELPRGVELRREEHDRHRHVGLELADHGDELRAGAARQVHVHQHEIGAELGQERQDAQRVARALRADANGLQRDRVALRELRRIIDDQHALGLGRSSAGYRVERADQRAHVRRLHEVAGAARARGDQAGGEIATRREEHDRRLQARGRHELHVGARAAEILDAQIDAHHHRPEPGLGRRRREPRRCREALDLITELRELSPQLGGRLAIAVQQVDEPARNLCQRSDRRRRFGRSCRTRGLVERVE